ncbi:hypothetical protein Hypma_002276 [Hypsizygus marmoreus]|uniref:Uncharacterized protein n=1 Tax=Hypsizygus marmoreus TaxID=39966 RepID=A0A369KAD9_HYPMA|nr:hypothetical protein Hypma_002276 [Hypsizygus marmoreus]
MPPLPPCDVSIISYLCFISRLPFFPFSVFLLSRRRRLPPPPPPRVPWSRSGLVLGRWCNCWFKLLYFLT